MRAARSRAGSNSKSSSGVYLKAQRFADFAADEAAGAFEAGDCGGGADAALEVREVDVAMAQVVVHFHCGQRDPAQARVAQVAHQQA